MVTGNTSWVVKRLGANALPMVISTLTKLPKSFLEISLGGIKKTQL